MAGITVGLVMLVMAATPAAQMGAAVAMVDIDEFHHERHVYAQAQKGDLESSIHLTTPRRVLRGACASFVPQASIAEECVPAGFQFPH